MDKETITLSRAEIALSIESTRSLRTPIHKASYDNPSLFGAFQLKYQSRSLG